MEQTRGIAGESARSSFSSQDLAKFRVEVQITDEGEEANAPSQGGVLFDKLDHMVDTTAELTAQSASHADITTSGSTDQASQHAQTTQRLQTFVDETAQPSDQRVLQQIGEQQLDTSVIAVTGTESSPNQSPDIFNGLMQPFGRRHEHLTYLAEPTLKEQIEWLSPQVDNETGKIIGEIKGSVIGRDAQKVVVIDSTGHRENKIREIIYVRWNSPNPNLLQVQNAECNLVKGSTGIEVEIVRYVQDVPRPPEYYSGWYKTKNGEREIVDQRVKVVEQKKEDQGVQISPEILDRAPISIRVVSVYPSVESKEIIDAMTLEAITDKTHPTIPIFVAEEYNSSPGVIGNYKGRDISARKTAYKGELYFDKERKTRMIRISRHFQQDPGNMLLKELAQQQNFDEYINKRGESEYVVRSVVPLEEAIKQGYVFSEFVDTTQSASSLAVAA